MNPKEEVRIYKVNECISFRKTTEKYGGLSNMASGYPLVVNGIYIKSSEALYQAMRFPHLPKIQMIIINESSPMTAKMISKKYRFQTRNDWEEIKISIMRWVLRVKLIQNIETFGKLLLETGTRPIVEESSKDQFWGAFFDGKKYEGMNVLGRLLMELREVYKKHNINMLNPLKISDFKLNGEYIKLVENINDKYKFQNSKHLFNCNEVE